MSILGKLVDL